MTQQQTSRLDQPDETIKPSPRPGAAVATDPARADAAFGTEKFRVLPMSSRVHTAARKALSEMHDASAELAEALKAVQGTGTRSSDGQARGDWRVVPGGGLRAFSGREPQLVDAAADRFASVAQRVDQSLADLADAENTLTQAVTNKLKDPRAETPGGVALASEVRSFLREIDTTERTVFLNSRIQAGDIATVGAVLSAPGYLAGLDAQAREVVHGLAAKQFAPTESAALDGARRAAEMIKSAGGVFSERWKKSVAQLGPSQRDHDAKIAQVRGGGAA